MPPATTWYLRLLSPLATVMASSPTAMSKPPTPPLVYSDRREGVGDAIQRNAEEEKLPALHEEPYITPNVKIDLDTMTETTFEDVYSEVKKVNRRLDSMEKTLRALMTMLLPEEEISEEEWREITAIDEEMARGECTTLTELKKKHGVK